MEPLLYVIGLIVSDMLFYFLSAIPFWGSERIKKSWVLLIIFAAALFRTVLSTLFAFMPGGLMWIDLCDLVSILLWLTALYVCFKVHITRLIYSMLLMLMLAISIDGIAFFIVNPFLPGEGVMLTAEPLWIIIDAVLIAATLPFVYRLTTGMLRRELANLPVRSVLLLLLTPTGFYIAALTYFLLLGWYSNVPIAGIIIFLGLTLSFFQLWLIKNTRELQKLEIRNEFLLDNYKTLENYFSQIAQMKHDIHYHLFAVRTLFENGEQEQLAKYLSDWQDSYAEIEEPIACGNRLLQAVLTHAAQIAQRMGFKIKFELSPMPPLAVADTDIVGFFMNLLENALEACALVPEGQKRFINMTISWREPYLNIRCENSKTGEIPIKGGVIQSRKPESGHGFGLKSIKRIVDAYEGMMNIEYDENTFTVTAVLKNKQHK